jgi:hypothetical protein
MRSVPILQSLALSHRSDVMVLNNTRHRPWLTALLARRPTKVAAIALANKIARMAWAMMARPQPDHDKSVLTGQRPGDLPGLQLAVAARVCAAENCLI